MLKNLADPDVHVGVDPVESGVPADTGQPPGTSHLDFPGFCCWGLFNDRRLFWRRSPSSDEWKKENQYAQLNKEIGSRSKREDVRISNFSQSFRL